MPKVKTKIQCKEEVRFTRETGKIKRNTTLFNQAHILTEKKLPIRNRQIGSAKRHWFTYHESDEGKYVQC